MEEFKVLRQLSSLKTGDDFKLDDSDAVIYTKTNMSVNDESVCFRSDDSEKTLEIPMNEWVYTKGGK